MAGCGHTEASPAQPAASTAAAVDTADLGSLIAAEDAAIYAYGVIGAHLHGQHRAAALASLAVHRRLRDTWIAAAHADGQEIPAAAIAYDLPIDVRDSSSAESLEREIETRLIAVYQSAGDTAASALAKAQARLAQLTPAG